MKADLSQHEDRERLVETTVATYGPVDILVNNAAVTYFIPVVDFPEKRLQADDRGAGVSRRSTWRSWCCRR